MRMDVSGSGNMETTGKIYVKQPHEILKDSLLKSDDVQRAIEGLKDIPDEELQEFLNEEDFMEGLDVVDAWEGDEDRNRETEHAVDTTEREERRPSRERHHQREHKASYSRDKSKREERKREEALRRDPAKSTKDIERDKIRTKRDTESKLLAEKEKAIKHLLDSDNVVPPGTETEAIQSIAEKQNLERVQQREKKSRERRRSVDRYGRLSPSRRRTPDRLRLSPHRRRSPFMPSPVHRRSPFSGMSTERHRSPCRYSPGKRRNSPRYVSDRRSPSVPSPDRRRSPRRVSWERRSSVDRRWSAERHRRRSDIHERRRSRSRDRRSRSVEHTRRRSSRSPINRRYSPRRRSRTRSRSTEKRSRKRSPFINELTRQLRNEAMIPPTNVNSGYVTPAVIEQIAPLLNTPVYQQEVERPPLPPPPAYMLQPPAPPPPPSVLPMPSGPPTFMNFEMPAVPMTFEAPMPSHTMLPADYSAGPVMYNQPNTAPIQAPLPPPAIRPPLLPPPVSVPQPVPAPTMDHGQLPYNPSHGVSPIQQSSIRQFESTNKSSNHSTAQAATTSSQSYKERNSATSYNTFHAPHEERLKTPEPPVISKPKQFEKTSLSSLLEASVSAKDSSNIPVLYPGFKPEIMRHCEQALCQLPLEDPRLKMKGRFFYVREEEYAKNDSEDHTSNSILLQRGKNKIYWEENVEQPIPVVKPTTQMHQKICQTEEVETDVKGVQATVTMVDFESQVCPNDFQQANKEERRPIMDRLDWNMREICEYTPKFHEVDLRWSLNNSSQRRSWNRQASPPRRPDEHEHHLDSIDHGSRSLRLDSPFTSKDSFSTHKMRDHYNHNKYSPDYRRSMERDNFYDRRSEHSRGESPMELENSDDELVTGHTFQKEADWHGRGKVLRGNY